MWSEVWFQGCGQLCLCCIMLSIIFVSRSLISVHWLCRKLLTRLVSLFRFRSSWNAVCLLQVKSVGRIGSGVVRWNSCVLCLFLFMCTVCQGGIHSSAGYFDYIFKLIWVWSRLFCRQCEHGLPVLHRWHYLHRYVNCKILGLQILTINLAVNY